jgi:hypothetical protein
VITRARAHTGLALATILVLTVTASAEHPDHEKDIEQAVLNYANALYDMKPELIVESVSPKLQKVGYMPARDGSGLVEDWMTFEQLEELAGHLNENGMFDPATSPRDVTILHYTDMIATVGRRVAEQLADPANLTLVDCPLPLQGFTLQMAYNERFAQYRAHTWLRGVVQDVGSSL